MFVIECGIGKGLKKLLRKLKKIKKTVLLETTQFKVCDPFALDPAFDLW